MALRESNSNLSFEERRPDLSEGTLVMCTKSGLCCWYPRYYLGEGMVSFLYTKSGNPLIEWEYIVPLNRFHPDSPEWLPSEEDNWGHFGKQENEYKNAKK